MDRFTRAELIILAVAVAVAAVAGVFAWTNFTRAFSEAHLSFAVNRTSSAPVAETFLRRHAPAAAAALAGRRHAAIFRVDDGAKVYLERELGPERLETLTRGRQVRLWNWSHRWFRPVDKEEVRVDVTPEGEVAGFAHLVKEESTGAALPEGEARALGERFLKDALNLEPEALTFIESKREDRKSRRDWTFTYERSGWKASGATYRMQVEVHGDEPAAYREYLKVPEAWTQAYDRLRSANDTTALVAAFGIVLTLLAALVVLFREGRRGNVRWRLVLGFTAVAFGLFFLMSLNDLPLAAYGFDTTGTYGAFLGRQVLAGLAGAGVQALLIFIVVAAGEPLFRARFPGHLRVTALFERAGWRSKRFAFGLVLGYCLAAVFLAYQVAFYLIGSRFGAWNPVEVPFDNLLNTSFPWLAVLFIGFYPAVSEEFMSRVFSIPLVDRLTHSRVASVVIPALIWGFAHANYPAQPFYIRGLEVSIAGLFVGVILYRFGVLPCLVWHYVVDAGYTSMLLVRSGNLYFVITALAGVGALLVPLAVTLAAAWRRGGFVDDPAVLNGADPAPPEPPVAAAPAPAPIVAPPLRTVLPVGLALALAAGVLAWRAPDAGRGVGVTRRPAAVREAAEAFLRGRGLDPSRWRFVVTTTGDVLGSAVRRYLLEHGGVGEVGRFAREVPAWQVRAFRPEEREAWRLSVDDASGRVVRFDHALREETPGAVLPPDKAREVAAEGLAAAGLDPSRLVFKEVKSEKRTARTDHTFTWKDSSRSVADAEYLLDVRVQGDAVDALTRRFKLPEAWERAREKTTVARIARIAVMVGVLSMLVVHGLGALYLGVRRDLVPWRRVLWIGAGLGAISAAGLALDLPLAWAQYPSAYPEALFRTSTYVGVSIVLLVLTAAAVAALGALASAFPELSRDARGDRRPVALASAAAAAGAVGGVIAFRWLVGFARTVLPTAFPDAPLGVPGSLATAFPALAGLGTDLWVALMALTVAAMAIHLWQTLGSPWRKAALAAGLLVAAVPAGSEASSLEFAAGLAQAAVALGGAVLLARYVFGRNPIAYLLAAAWLGVLGVAAPLVAQPGRPYAVQGWALVAVALGASAWWLLHRPRPQTNCG